MTVVVLSLFFVHVVPCIGMETCQWDFEEGEWMECNFGKGFFTLYIMFVPLLLWKMSGWKCLIFDFWEGLICFLTYRYPIVHCSFFSIGEITSCPQTYMTWLVGALASSLLCVGFATSTVCQTHWTLFFSWVEGALVVCVCVCVRAYLSSPVTSIVPSSGSERLYCSQIDMNCVCVIFVV